MSCANADRFSEPDLFRHHKRRIGNKAVCERKRQCGTCGELAVSDKNTNAVNAIVSCAAGTEVGHVCYMQPLKNVLPSSDGVLYIFYDFETT